MWVCLSVSVRACMCECVYSSACVHHNHNDRGEKRKKAKSLRPFQKKKVKKTIIYPAPINGLKGLEVELQRAWAQTRPQMPGNKFEL